MHARIRTHRLIPGYILAEVHPAPNNCMLEGGGGNRQVIGRRCRRCRRWSSPVVVVGHGRGRCRGRGRGRGRRLRFRRIRRIRRRRRCFPAD